MKNQAEDFKAVRNKGISRAMVAATYSWAGLKAAFRLESAFRQELLLAVLMVPWLFILGLSPLAKAWLLGTVLLVLIVELLNSAIEACVDLISPDHHPLAKLAKDMGSAAVLLALLVSGSSWIWVLGEYFGWF